MSFFNQAPNAAPNGGNRSVAVVFDDIPQTLATFSALPQAAMQRPSDTAALFIAAMCVYPRDTQTALQMIDVLKGPQPLSGYDKQFIADRMRGKDYVPRSYFVGATPENNYMPTHPYTIMVSENPYSYQEQGYAKLFLKSGGADSPRPIQLRQAKDGKWYLWEQFLLADIRPTADSDPWA